MSEFTLSPILGNIADLGTATKPFRVNNGKLEVETSPGTYGPVIETVDLGYTGIFEDTPIDKPLSTQGVVKYLLSLGLSEVDGLISSAIIGKPLAQDYQSAYGHVQHAVNPGATNMWYDYNAKYYHYVGNQVNEVKDVVTEDYQRQPTTSINGRLEVINEAIGATGETGTMLWVESQMKKLNNFLINGSAEHLTPTNHISDYVSLDHSVWYEGQGEPILISLNNLYYRYNQLMYKDDAGIMEDPEDTDDERFTPIGTETHELKYGFYEIPNLYGRKAVSGSIVELILKYHAYNNAYIQRVVLVVDPNYDGIPQRVKVQIPGTDSVAFIIEVSTDCIVAYPSGDDISDYRIKDARVLI